MILAGDHMKYKRPFAFSIYNWGVIIFGIPFIALLALTGIDLKNVYLISSTIIPLFFVYVFLARDNYYFELTSNKLIILNDFIPWKKRSFLFAQISKVKDGLVSIIITTDDNRIREFRASLSSKGIENLMKDMKKKAPRINYEEWNGHRNKEKKTVK